MWLLLVVAFGQWLYTAYRAARVQLSEGVHSMWQAAQLQAVDAFRVATIVINSGADSVHVREQLQQIPPAAIHAMTIRKGVSSRSVDTIGTERNGDVIELQVDRRVLHSGDSMSGTVAIADRALGYSVIVLDGSDAESTSHQILDSGIDPRIANAIDTMRLRAEFTRQMAGQRLGVQWRVEAEEGPGEDLARLEVEAGDGRYLVASVTGTQRVLVRRMLPLLIGVSLVLLLSGGALLAFYRMQRRLYRVSVFQRDFARNMAHEMRTPLATLRLLLERLKAGDDQPDTQKYAEYLELAYRETGRLTSLAERLGAAARSGDASLQLNVERIDLMALLRASVALFEPMQSRVGATIDLPDIENGTIFVEMDGVYLRSVVDNVLDNALKYGGAGVHIAIGVARRGGAVLVEITDDGPGVAPEHADKLFERFYRVPTGERLPVRGLGVGLYFCREAMRAHGGDITLGRAPGTGCRFTLRIPA